jgi:hypothetical protein
MSHIIKRSKYKGVFMRRDHGKYDSWYYSKMINYRRYQGNYDTEREAAIAYDMALIENGKQPVNILKPK